MDLTILYCNVDDFWKPFKQEWDKHLINNGKIREGQNLDYQLLKDESEQKDFISDLHAFTITEFKTEVTPGHEGGISRCSFTSNVTELPP